jgi:hypothetical protein
VTEGLTGTKVPMHLTQNCRDNIFKNGDSGIIQLDLFTVELKQSKHFDTLLSKHHDGNKEIFCGKVMRERERESRK